MSRFLKTLLLTAAATGAVAFVLNRIDLDAARSKMNTPGSGFPGLDPDDMEEEDVAMLLDELASHL